MPFGHSRVVVRSGLRFGRAPSTAVRFRRCHTGLPVGALVDDVRAGAGIGATASISFAPTKTIKPSDS